MRRGEFVCEKEWYSYGPKEGIGREKDRELEEHKNV